MPRPYSVRAARFGDGWAPWQTRPEDFPAKLDYLKSQPGYDGRPFALFFSLASLNIGLEHEINDDPHSQFGQDAQQVIDSCNMLAGLGVTGGRYASASQSNVWSWVHTGQRQNGSRASHLVPSIATS